MAVPLDGLKQLQTLDIELYQLRRAQQQRPQDLEEANTKVAEETERLKEIEEKLKQLQLAHKEKEIELQTCETNVQKLQGQLFQLKTNKEYSAMQKEIGVKKADNSMLEETILEMLEGIDVATSARAAQQQKHSEKQAWFANEKKRIDQELSVIVDKISQLETNRDQIAEGVDPKFLTFYERVLEMREGVALAPVTGQSCGGCHRRLPPQVVNQVYLKDNLVTCESCSRILYKDENVVDA